MDLTQLLHHLQIAAWFKSNPFCLALFCLMFLDIMTGLIAAFVTKKLCSTASYRGMLGKVQILAMVATAMLMELVIPNIPWGTFVSLFFCVTEAISITENAANSGVPIPQQWTDALKKARQEEDVRRTRTVNVLVGDDAEQTAVKTKEVVQEAVKEGVEETKRDVRTAVHDIRDALHTATIKSQAESLTNDSHKE